MTSAPRSERILKGPVAARSVARPVTVGGGVTEVGERVHELGLADREVDLRIEGLLIGEPLVSLGSGGWEVNRRDHATTVTVATMAPETAPGRRATATTDCPKARRVSGVTARDTGITNLS
jgi:hypothetical protein